MTSVVYVQKSHAKQVKTYLESNSLLDKRYRMIPVSSSTSNTTTNNNTQNDDDIKDCIAIPVKCIDFMENDNDDNLVDIQKMIIRYGAHDCPYSTSMLGNNNKNMMQNNNKSSTELSSSSLVSTLTHLQYALVETLTSLSSGEDTNAEERVRKLSKRTCQTKLEVIGDDRTLVIPRFALYVDNNPNDEFYKLLYPTIKVMAKNEEDVLNSNNERKHMFSIQSHLWEVLASIYNTQRIVRRGDIDPESGIRESGHRILYPAKQTSSQLMDGCDEHIDSCNEGYISTDTGPSSPGWITVTEHSIHQSFDITRVMFSRGNVTEKKRFASLVQTDENVLDMYAGIGYYTLPALIHGKAKHVTACEWNEHALFALRYNLKANGVEDDRFTILEGDCRVSLKRLLEEDNSTAQVRQFDRISLGLLPSSEGGWSLAVSCLKNKSVGGMLHIHANVTTMERESWTHWLCRSLSNLAVNSNGVNWIAVCTHVEKVKSFAPKVDHVVADVFVGPCDSSKVPLTDGKRCLETGVLNSMGEFIETPLDTPVPSCALNKDGVLHQNWMGVVDT